jgi:hypothetical protein
MYQVCVDWYSLEAGKVGCERKPLARYEHRTLASARRRLASIIFRRSERTRRAYDELYHAGRQFYISAPDGRTLSLRMAVSET